MDFKITHDFPKEGTMAQKKVNIYLVQLIEQPITYPEFLKQIFCLFTFLVFSLGKSFKLLSQYTQKCQYNSLH